MAQGEIFPIDAGPGNNPAQVLNRDEDREQNRIEKDNQQQNAINQAANRAQEQQDNQVAAEQDRVDITAAAREQNGAGQAPPGAEADPATREGNVETPPVRDQQGEERGARQRVRNLEDENARGFNGPQDTNAGAQAVVADQADSPVNNPPGTPNEDIRGLANTAEAQDGTRREQIENPVVQEARRAREPINSNVGPGNFQQVIEENAAQRAAAEKAEQPLFDRATDLLKPPDQPAGVEQIAQADQDRLTGSAQQEQDAEANRLQQAPDTNPAAVQTETGRNVDRLI